MTKSEPSVHVAAWFGAHPAKQKDDKIRAERTCGSLVRRTYSSSKAEAKFRAERACGSLVRCTCSCMNDTDEKTPRKAYRQLGLAHIQLSDKINRNPSKAYKQPGSAHVQLSEEDDKI